MSDAYSFDPSNSYGSNYMQGPVNPQDLTTITTPGGRSVRVHPAAADSFKGFLTDIEAAGAPLHSLGGYANRNIAGTGHMSQHAAGNAIDIDQHARNDVDPSFRQWAMNNQDALRGALQKYNIVNGGNWRNPDFGHFEWDPRGGDSAPNTGGTMVASRSPNGPNGAPSPQGGTMASDSGNPYDDLISKALVNQMARPQNQGLVPGLDKAAIYLMSIGNPQALSALGNANRDAERQNQLALSLLQHQQGVVDRRQNQANIEADRKQRMDDNNFYKGIAAGQRNDQLQLRQTAPVQTYDRFGNPSGTVPRDQWQQQHPGAQPPAGAQGNASLPGTPNATLAAMASGGNPMATPPTPDTLAQAYGQGTDQDMQNSQGGPALQRLAAMRSPMPNVVPAPQGSFGGSLNPTEASPQGGAQPAPQPQASGQPPQGAPLQPSPQPVPDKQGSYNPQSPADYQRMIQELAASQEAPEAKLARLSPADRLQVQRRLDGSIPLTGTGPEHRIYADLAGAIDPEGAMADKFANQKRFTENDLDVSKTGSLANKAQSVRTMAKQALDLNERFSGLGNSEGDKSTPAFVQEGVGVNLPYLGRLATPNVNMHQGGDSGPTGSGAAKAYDRYAGSYGREVAKFMMPGNSNGTVDERNFYGEALNSNAKPSTHYEQMMASDQEGRRFMESARQTVASQFGEGSRRYNDWMRGTYEPTMQDLDKAKADTITRFGPDAKSREQTDKFAGSTPSQRGYRSGRQILNSLGISTGGQ
jgi:D-alanyl-D-alanine carboxypeptidase